MIKKLAYLFGFVLVLFLATFIAGNKLLSVAFRKQFARLPSYGEKHAVEISEPWFQSLAISSTQQLTWTNISLRFRLLNPQFDTKTSYLMRIPELHLRSSDHSYRRLMFEALGVEIHTPESLSSDLNMSESTIRQLGAVNLSIDSMKLEFDSDPGNPGAAIADRLAELASFLTTGKMSVPLEFTGDVRFRINQKVISVPLTMEEEDGYWVPILKRESMEPIANYFGEELTEPELALLVKNPMRAPMVIASKEYINVKLRELPTSSTDKSRAKVPVEAYRYVLWGYLLTKLVGPQFAQEISEAHIAGATLKSPAQRQSDGENAALGRRLAEEDVPQSDLLNLAIKEGSVPNKRFEWSVK